MDKPEAAPPWPRAILHADMDAFYASVEQLDHPEWRGRPLIVGGKPDERGVVSAASYEARPYGVRSAMPVAQALRRCPRAILAPVRMERYAEVSERIMDIFQRVTPLVEPLSLDEAFLDVTACQRLHGSPERMARRLKLTVRRETGLAVSVGVAPNRFLAKIASDLDKPDGLAVIRAEDAARRLAPLPVERIWGVGPVMAEKLHRLGLRAIGEVAAWPVDALAQNLGDFGRVLARLAIGLDDSPVVADGENKSVSKETTFPRDVTDPAELERELLAEADEVMRRLRAAGRGGRTVTLKIRYSDFSTLTRRRTQAEPFRTAAELHRAARRLLREKTAVARRPVRLIGLAVSGWSGGEAENLPENQRRRQGRLFDPPPAAGAAGNGNGDGEAGETRDPERVEQAERAAERIREKLGDNAIVRAALLPPPTGNG